MVVVVVVVVDVVIAVDPSWHLLSPLTHSLHSVLILSQLWNRMQADVGLW